MRIYSCVMWLFDRKKQYYSSKILPFGLKVGATVINMENTQFLRNHLEIFVLFYEKYPIFDTFVN